jgi:hypothetical protein
MFFQAFDRGMEPRWQTSVDKSAPGARGSHMCPVVDINRDGVDELMWGERCIELDRGTELFCADRDEWRGHSDVAQPVLDRESGRWFLYTCRESDQKAAPRVALYDDTGRRIWGAVDYGHIDMGWVARIGPGARPVASAIRISTKTCGPDGRHHKDCEEFSFDAMTGRPVELPFATYRTEPVDLNGDGFHELVRGIPGSDGEVLGSDGKVLGSVGGPICMASKFFDRPGEQVLTYSPQGVVRVWRDANAEDSDAAKERYANPFYRTTQRLSASGSNVRALGGL